MFGQLSKVSGKTSRWNDHIVNEHVSYTNWEEGDCEVCLGDSTKFDMHIVAFPSNQTKHDLGYFVVLLLEDNIGRGLCNVAKLAVGGVEWHVLDLQFLRSCEC